jgi:hypothetical protein
MATISATAFTRSKTLSKINPTILRQFLSNFPDFWRSRGISLDAELDLIAIIEALMEPGPDTPSDLIDALFCIKEMSIPSALDVLLDEALRVGIKLDNEMTQAEIVLRLWMADQQSLWNKHAELTMLRVRSFEYFSALDDETAEAPSPGTLQSLERSLDIFFGNCGHGTGTRVHIFPRAHEMWFLVRRGDLYRREATLENGRSGIVAFRPQKYDFLIYNQLTNELGINAKTKKIRNEYRKHFSFYMFGRDNQFAGTSKYSLEPLRTLGRHSLNVLDVPGIESVKLTLLEWTVKIDGVDVSTRRAADLFTHFEQQDFQIADSFDLKKATFRIQFEGNATPRSVTIKPANVALYGRYEDAPLVEEWLMRRGFIVQGQINGSEQQELRISMS